MKKKSTLIWSAPDSGSGSSRVRSGSNPSGSATLNEIPGQKFSYANVGITNHKLNVYLTNIFIDYRIFAKKIGISIAA